MILHESRVRAGGLTLMGVMTCNSPMSLTAQSPPLLIFSPNFPFTAPSERRGMVGYFGIYLVTLRTAFAPT